METTPPNKTESDRIYCPEESFCISRKEIDEANTVMEYATYCKEALANCLTRPYFETPPIEDQKTDWKVWVVSSVAVVLALSGGFLIGHLAK